MNANDESSELLALLIFRSYRGHKLLPIEAEHLVSLKMLYVASSDIGDPLFEFIISEIYEGATDKDGEIDLGRAVELLDRGELDLANVRLAIQRLEAEQDDVG